MIKEKYDNAMKLYMNIVLKLNSGKFRLNSVNKGSLEKYFLEPRPYFHNSVKLNHMKLELLNSNGSLSWEKNLGGQRCSEVTLSSNSSFKVCTSMKV